MIKGDNTSQDHLPFLRSMRDSIKDLKSMDINGSRMIFVYQTLDIMPYYTISPYTLYSLSLPLYSLTPPPIFILQLYLALLLKHISHLFIVKSCLFYKNLDVHKGWDLHPPPLLLRDLQIIFSKVLHFLS